MVFVIETYSGAKDVWEYGNDEILDQYICEDGETDHQCREGLGGAEGVGEHYINSASAPYQDRQ